jgi:hypothetical protein
MAVGLSASKAGSILLLERVLVLISVTGWVDHKVIVRLEGFN